MAFQWAMCSEQVDPRFWWVGTGSRRDTCVHNSWVLTVAILGPSLFDVTFVWPLDNLNSPGHQVVYRTMVLGILGQTWGIYPDLLHIVDLQICHDVISSTLLDLTDGVTPRDRKLLQLCSSYETWCREQRTMAQLRIVFLMSLLHMIKCPFEVAHEDAMDMKNICYFLYGSMQSGVPFASRASRKLFTSKILLAGGTASYCSISQKILKGAAARLFMYWLCTALVAEEDSSLHGMCCG